MWRAVAGLAMRGLSEARAGSAIFSPTSWVRVPKCGYTTVITEVCTVRDQFRKFLGSQLETVKDVEGAKFLRLPPFLCQEWGYRFSEPLLLKRDCYDVLNAKLDAFFNTPAFQSVVVLGTSGIGKSGYCLYLLWHLVKCNTEWSMIVLNYAEGSGLFYIFTKYWDGSVIVNLERDSHAVRRLAAQHGGSPGRVWYLADKRVPVSHLTLPGHCHFVLTCSGSPKENHHSKQLSKYNVSVNYYLPVWSKEEILQLNKAVFRLPEQEVHETFRMWGGVPLYVLANRFSDTRLFFAIKSAARKMTYFPANPNSIQKEEDHLVYHYDVDPKTCELHSIYSPLRLASEFVAAEVAKPLPPSVIDALALGDASENFRATLFGTFFYRLLEHSIPVSSREMDEQGEWGPVLNEDLPLVRFEMTPKLSAGGSNGALPDRIPPFLLDFTAVWPESSSNRSWDFILGPRIFQATIPSRQGGKKLEMTQGLVEASEFLRRCYSDGTQVEFIYFVPSKMFETFTPTLPGAITELNVRVKKMCLRMDRSLADDVKALKQFSLDSSSSTHCNISRPFQGSKTFDAMELRDNLLHGISDYGYKVPTLLQQKVIVPFCRGMNVLEQAPEGSGCTSALCIALLERIDSSRGQFQAVVLTASHNQALEILRQMLALKSYDVNLKIHTTTSLRDEDWCHVLVGTPPDVYHVCNSLSKESLVSLSILGVDGVDEISETLGLREMRLLLKLIPEQRQLGIFASCRDRVYIVGHH